MQISAQMPATVRLLCVEDNIDDLELLGYALARADSSCHYMIERAEDAAGFLSLLQHPVDVVLCDYHLPRFSPHEALKLLAARSPSVPLIVLTHAIGEDAAMEVLRQGAKDYVTKDKLGTLPQVIERVLAEKARVAERDRLVLELEAAYSRLKRLSSRLVMAQEQERTLMSRELHDVLGQCLTAIIIHLHAARQASGERADAFMDTAVQAAHEAIQQVKALSFSLRPAQLDLLGLMAAIRFAVQRVADPGNLVASVSSRGAEPRVLSSNASVVVRLVQEASTNVVRHAHASRILVRVRFLPDQRISVIVADNGVGFDRSKLLDGQAGEHNLGLYGMIERTELVGGKLSIRTAPGHGTIVRAVL